MLARRPHRAALLIFLLPVEIQPAPDQDRLRAGQVDRVILAIRRRVIVVHVRRQPRRPVPRPEIGRPAARLVGDDAARLAHAICPPGERVFRPPRLQRRAEERPRLEPRRPAVIAARDQLPGNRHERHVAIRVRCVVHPPIFVEIHETVFGHEAEPDRPGVIELDPVLHALRRARQRVVAAPRAIQCVEHQHDVVDRAGAPRHGQQIAVAVKRGHRVARIRPVDLIDHGLDVAAHGSIDALQLVLLGLPHTAHAAAGGEKPDITPDRRETARRHAAILARDRVLAHRGEQVHQQALRAGRIVLHVEQLAQHVQAPLFADHQRLIVERVQPHRRLRFAL